MLESDFLIVGSGPAGISAAWPLVRSGRQVTMVDAGSGEVPAAPGPDIVTLRSSPDGWKDVLGADLGGLEAHLDHSPKLATVRGRAVLRAGASGWPAVEASTFSHARANSVGGLSSIWGAVCSAFDDRDLRDFPIGPDDLARSYSAVAERIGVSGAEDALAEFHGRVPLLPPTPLTAPLDRVLRRYDTARRSGSEQNRNAGFSLGRGRNAVITTAAPEWEASDRQPCNGCGLCLHGCARSSIYDSGRELARLRSHDNFRYLPSTRVTRLVELGQDLQTVDLWSPQGYLPAQARRLILAAGTLTTTALLLDHAGLQGTPIRLLSNPLGAMAVFVPSCIGRDFPARSFALAQLSFSLDLAEDDYATGAAYGADTLPLNLLAKRMPLSRGAAMKLAAVLAPATIPLNCFLGSRHSNNWVTLEGSGNSAVMKIDGSIGERTRTLLKTSSKRIAASFSRYGAYAIPGSFTMPPPGADLHPAGTTPMGRSAPLSCTETCALIHAQGVYVVDGSWLPSLPAKHCTFTIMANADRVGHILSETTT